MPKSLVIVESPAKAKTINRYLGPDYIVEASVGHVRDLPREGLSIDIAAGFVPTYKVIRGKEAVVKRLRSLAGQCERVFLATDPDREGEAIAQHIAEEIRGQNRNITRVLFNEITKSGIGAAMRQPRAIDSGMVQAQEARRVMDRLIGYKVSPYLWRRFAGEAKGLSAGRVQSVALRLVAERERAINSFIPIEYWSLIGTFLTRSGKELTAKLVRADGVELRNPSGSAEAAPAPGSAAAEAAAPTFISTKRAAEALRERVLAEQYAISSLITKEARRNAPQPFTTSTLQQEASKKLRMNPARTMKLAQQLYEGVDLGARGRTGLVTYMRTDSVRISDEAAAAAEEFIFSNYGKEYLPPSGAKTTAVARKPKANVQDAHEAIRPVDPAITPREARRHLEGDLAALYELIWSRFIASRMAAAIFDRTTVEITGGPFTFRAVGSVLRFRGWMQVYTEAEEEREEQKPKRARGTKGTTAADAKREDAQNTGSKEWGNAGEDGDLETVLPEGLAKGDPLELRDVETRQSFTKPPQRYTESLLIKDLEAKGIGRPSTYAAIISTIQERGYVEQRQRKLYATDLGMRVSDVLVKGFPALFDVKFTARMEGQLDTIAGGSATYLAVMSEFYVPLVSALKAAQNGNEDGDMRALPSTEEPRRAASLARARGGKRGTRKGAPGARAPRAPKPPAEPTGVACEKCGAPMVRRKAKGGSEFLGCSAYPTCRVTKGIPSGITCPGCGTGAIVERVGGRLKSTFYACSRYPDCRFTSSLKPVNRPCPRCGNAWLVTAWQKDRGEFTECPKCKAEGG